MEILALKKHSFLFAATTAAIGAVALLALLFGNSITPKPLPARAAAVDYFLKIDGMEGESQRRAGWIDLESFSWGMSQSGAHATGGGTGAGKVNVQDISIVKTIDKTSPILMLACAKGEHIPKVKLALHKSGLPEAEDYYTITLENALCSSFQQSGSGGDLPMESVSFNFEKIKVEYKVQDAQGGTTETVSKGWDVKKQKEF